MFNIGFTELIIIACLALVFVGPDKMPGMIQKMAKYWVKFRRTSNEFKYLLQEEVEKQVKKETSLEDVKREITNFSQTVTGEGFSKEMIDFSKDIKEETEVAVESFKDK